MNSCAGIDVASPANGHALTPQRVRTVAVCICTLRRPALLRRLLLALDRQQPEAGLAWSIVVVDNDPDGSAWPVVAGLLPVLRIEITYTIELEKNIALTRNRALAAATGDYVAFLDDDEYPVADWLRLMVDACERHQADAVLGPVRPDYENPPPRWVVAGRFCERPEHPTGAWLPWRECRTGNVLFRRELVAGEPEPFRRQFGTGGEDVDFFQRHAARGRRFVWCNEAIAYEAVPAVRCTRGYMLRRALLRGRNGLKLSRGRAGLIARSLLALPAYALWLPIAALFGQAAFMKYCIKSCDHLGRLLALVRLNPVHERSS